MTDQQLKRYLQTIGKSCFITFFDELYDRALPDETVAGHITERWKRSESSALTRRVRPARRIIDAGRAKDALLDCANSKGLPRPIRDKAAALADSL